MMRPPSSIEKEIQHLIELYFSQFTEEEMQEDFDKDDFDIFFNSRISEATRIWEEYRDHIGDEGELLEKDGSTLLDKNGHWILNYEMNTEGNAIMLDGTEILYSDGTPVPYPVLPDIIEELYREDGWEFCKLD